MLRATSILRKAAVKADRVTDTVTLDHEGRNRRRIALRAMPASIFCSISTRPRC
jgi:urease accessory protein